MSPIEIIAALFGLLSVWLTMKENIWCWPTGLVMVCLYVFIFYEARLYSDVLLQVVYIFLQIYGWHLWLRGSKHGVVKQQRQVLQIHRVTPLGTVGWSAVAIAGTFGLGFVMSRYTDASLPFWDAAITVFSLIAQWLMAQKVLECWLIWITVDVLAIGVYAVKGLYPTTGLYTVFLVLAGLGYLAWRQAYRKLALA